MLSAKRLLSVIVALSISLAMVMSVQASDQIPAPPQKQPIALVGGTIHTVSGPSIENATILFDKGKIVAIGKDVQLPPNTKTIDATGKHIYPSLIEANSSLGLIEVGAVAATRDQSEHGQVNPSVRAEVAINPDSELIPVARSNGVGVVMTQPSGGLISGQSAIIMLDGWTWEDMTMQSSAALMVNWPRMTQGGGRRFFFAQQQPGRFEETLKRNLKAIADIFKDARAYKAARGASAQGGAHHKADARLEAMLPVVDGEVPVWIRANHIKQIKSAVDWATNQNLNMVLIGGADAHLAMDLLKRKNVSVVVTPILRLPSRRHEAFDTPFTLPKKLHDAGIKFAIAGGQTGNGNDRNVPYHAAKAASYGLPKDVALKAVTQYPAQIMGVDDQIGTLEVGKDATLFISTGDPLEITSNVEHLFLQGRHIDLGDKQKQLYEKYKKKYEQKKKPGKPSTDD